MGILGGLEGNPPENFFLFGGFWYWWLAGLKNLLETLLEAIGQEGTSKGLVGGGGESWEGAWKRWFGAGYRLALKTLWWLYLVLGCRRRASFWGLLSLLVKINSFFLLGPKISTVDFFFFVIYFFSRSISSYRESNFFVRDFWTRICLGETQ